MPPSARLPELLAPAGSKQGLKAAVAAGADAVYLGGKRFGARKFASNFDLPDLARAVDYAHLRGVKVYVTVNTLIREDEIPDLAEYLVRLYEMGADAVLLQDLGAALLARSIVPELERHASTQMTIHNSQGVKWAGEAGFSRAVLAREVGLEQIKEMAREGGPGNVGLEVFVHGALCYSYSGQCLLSSAIGGRSGNRGMCAQPCRKPYILLSGQKDGYGRPAGLSARPLPEKFLLSTRDLCVYRHLKEIVRSPVASLKVEGRMKSPEYVAIVTSIYRKALDGIARGDWSPSQEDEMELALAFNRSFTRGHLLGESDVMGREMSDNRGVLIGSVSSFDAGKSEAAVRLSGALVPERGDGLVFQSPGQEVGLVVQRAETRDGLLRLKMNERVRPGARVYLTGSTALAQEGGPDHRFLSGRHTPGPATDLAGGQAGSSGPAAGRGEDLRCGIVSDGEGQESAPHPAADRIAASPDRWNCLCRERHRDGVRRGSLRSSGGPEPASSPASGEGRGGAAGPEKAGEGEGGRGPSPMAGDEAFFAGRGGLLFLPCWPS